MRSIINILLLRNNWRNATLLSNFSLSDLSFPSILLNFDLIVILDSFIVALVHDSTAISISISRLSFQWIDPHALLR